MQFIAPTHHKSRSLHFNHKWCFGVKSSLLRKKGLLIGLFAVFVLGVLILPSKSFGAQAVENWKGLTPLFYATSTTNSPSTQQRKPSGDIWFASTTPSNPALLFSTTTYIWVKVNVQGNVGLSLASGPTAGIYLRALPQSLAPNNYCYRVPALNETMSTSTYSSIFQTDWDNQKTNFFNFIKSGGGDIWLKAFPNKSASNANCSQARMGLLLETDYDNGDTANKTVRYQEFYDTGWYVPNMTVAYNGEYTSDPNTVSATSTRIIMTVPDNNATTSSSTSFYLDALTYINTDDWITYDHNIYAVFQYAKQGSYIGSEANKSLTIVNPNNTFSGGLPNEITFKAQYDLTNDFSTTSSAFAQRGMYAGLWNIVGRKTYLFGFWQTEKILAQKKVYFVIDDLTVDDVILNKYRAWTASTTDNFINSVTQSTSTCSWSNFDLSSCALALVVPDSSQVKQLMTDFRNNLLSLAPLGYVQRTYDIIATTSTTTLPVFSINFSHIMPTSMLSLVGLNTDGSGGTWSFSLWGNLFGPTSKLGTATSTLPGPNQGKTFVAITMEWWVNIWNIILLVSVVYYILTEKIIIFELFRYLFHAQRGHLRDDNDAEREIA